MTEKECVTCKAELRSNETRVCDICLHKTGYISFDELLNEGSM